MQGAVHEGQTGQQKYCNHASGTEPNYTALTYKIESDLESDWGQPSTIEGHI